MEGWKKWRMNGRRIDGMIDGWMSGWMDECINGLILKNRILLQVFFDICITTYTVNI
jgi:hypothetical protein